MYKILVLTNRIDVEVSDDFKKAVDYFKSKNINVSFDFKQVDQKVSVHAYKDGWYGLDDYVKEECAKITPVGKYRAVIFAWNTKDVPQPQTGFITSWCNYGPLSYDHLDTAFIQLITNDYNDKVNWIYLSAIHEVMHSFCSNLNRRGLSVVDEMDITKEGVEYLHNADENHPEGNFAKTLKNIEPYLKNLYEFYYFDLKNNQPLKVGSKGERVKQLQRDLKALGYFKYPFITGTFGSITKTAVQAFQKATGLTSDGVAGKLTLSEITKQLELKKKPNFGLDPKVEALAYLLIAKCKQLYGYNIRIIEGYRSQERQNELYASGRTKVGQILTNAKKSKHTSRLAFDVAFVGKDPYPKDDLVWKRIADVGVSIGLKAGYYFKSFRDAVHFEI